MTKNLWKFIMVLLTAGSVGYALGIGATDIAIFSAVYCAIFSLLLFGPDFTILRR